MRVADTPEVDDVELEVFSMSPQPCAARSAALAWAQSILVASMRRAASDDPPSVGTTASACCVLSEGNEDFVALGPGVGWFLSGHLRPSSSLLTSRVERLRVARPGEGRPSSGVSPVPTSRAADGIRTHDLLHGKQLVGLTVAVNVPANGLLLPREGVSPMPWISHETPGVSSLKPDRTLIRPAARLTGFAG